MKTQIKFQKKLTLISLIISALVFVYALIFFSGNLSGEGLMFYIGRKWDGLDFYQGADGFLLPAQSFVSALVVISIINILATVTLFITSCNKRRNYYVTNYVAVGLNIAMSVFVGFFTLIYVSVLMAKFYAIDWNELYSFIESLANKDATYYNVSKSPAIFIIGYFVSLIVLANAVAWGLNLIWKIKLMKGEKELLSNGFIKEVA